MGLSETNSKVLEFISSYIDENGYSPSYRNIRDGADLASISVVSYHLKRLEEHDCIRREKKLARSIRLVE